MELLNDILKVIGFIGACIAGLYLRAKSYEQRNKF
jgi:hypothetical protein